MHTVFPRYSRRAFLLKSAKTYPHGSLFPPRHTLLHPPSPLFYQFHISPNNKTALFSRLQIYKSTGRITSSFAAYYQVNYRAFNKWDSSSISSGTLFHIIWNIIPCHLEQRSTLAITPHFTIKRHERSGKSSSQTIKNRRHEIKNIKLKIYL